MKNIHIVTDSIVHIPSALCQEYDIKVVPLSHVWDDVTYFDFDNGPRDFYTKLRKSETIPTTSGPPPALFKEQYETLGIDGQPVLGITVGEFFLSSYKVTTLAKERSSSILVTVFSSDSNAMGHRFQVLAANRASREGRNF